MSLRRNSGGAPPVVGTLGRFMEYVLAMDVEQADGTVLATSLDTYSRFGFSAGGTADGQHLVRYSGAGQALYRIVDGYAWIQPTPGAINQALLLSFRPAAALPMCVGFRDVYGALAAPGIGAGVPRGFAVSIMAWCRKGLAGDNSTAKCCLGFAETTTIGGPGSSSLSPRIGLVGDGAGGYRFGSVNCPDGTAVPAENANNAIDANAVQPTILVAPGTGQFHVRVKMIPPTPENPFGRWEGYLNGALVATFNTVANFPRGNANVNKNYARLEPVMQNWGGVAAVQPSLMYRDVRLWLEQLEGVV